MEKAKFFLFTIIVTLCFSINVFGQYDYVFRHLKTDDGLSNSYVKSILKDSYGFLWVGTEFGLNRYDGYDFKIYSASKEKSNQLLSDNITDLKEDGLGNIWINTISGYTIYLRDKDSFVNDVSKYLKDLGIKIDLDYHIYIDKNQNLWVLSNQQIYVYNTHHKSLKSYHVKSPIKDVLSVEFSDSDKFLYGKVTYGDVLQLEKSTGNQQIIKLPNHVKQNNKLYVDSNNGLWLFNEKTDLIYHDKNLKGDWRELSLESLSFAKNNIVLQILDDEKGHIWIGTDHNGVFVYDIINDTTLNLLHDDEINASIASNNVGCFYQDNRGVMWLGHNKKGISFYHNSFHNFINIENQNSESKDVCSILEDRQGNFWLGTDGNGLYFKGKNKESKIKKMSIPNNAIVSLEEDGKGRIWVGTYLGGLYCYENGVFKNFTKENSKLASNSIWSLKKDRYGNIWIGTLRGGIQSITTKDEILSYKGVSTVLDMYYDGGDKLYAGTDYGLCIVDITTGEQKIYITNKKGTQKFKEFVISNVYKDSKDNIWFGDSKGLSIWDIKNDTVHYFDKNKGLCDNIISGIIEDNHNNIWVTTSNGLSVLSVENSNKRILNITSRNFSTKDGLKDNYFNNHSICELSNGDMFFGGTEGYTVVNPNKMAQKNEPLAKVVFTGLSIANKEILVDSIYNGHQLLEHNIEKTKELTLGYDDKLISLQFTTGDLLNADKVYYAYKMKGFNQDWVYTQENKITFSSLNPGDYKLMIKASNSDGVWNQEITNMNIVVRPPFYLSKLALILYVLFFIGLILFSIYRTRRHHHLKFEKQKKQLKLDQENHINEMKLRFFTNISHDLRTPLTLIITPLQTILNGDLEDGLRKKINMINKNAEQLLQLINSLLDFRKLDVGAETLQPRLGNYVNFIREICVPFNAYAEERQMSFSFSSEIEKLSMEFDPSKVKKIFFNLLSNAFKYTDNGGSVDVHLYQEEDYVCVSVSDSGQGISDVEKKQIFERFYQSSEKQEKTGSGLGLHIVNEYVHMHNGSISVADNLPHGSNFIFKLPIVEVIDTEEQNTEETVEVEILETHKAVKQTDHNVLLFVDDNLDLCSFIQDNLSGEYRVLVANNGREALEQLKKNDVHIVVSDVMMPVMSGTELCKQVKNNINWSHIPVILLTARAAEENKLEGLEMGADDYLTKPFNFEMLKLRISKFLEWTNKSHQSFSQKMDVSPAEITITPLDEQLIERAIKEVEKRIADSDFSVEELSAAVGLSRTHLYKKLMFITGKGPSEFIRTIRLKRGRQLLEESQLQISEIAYAVGFNSPKRFTINFKNEFGVSPSEYLKRLK